MKGPLTLFKESVRFYRTHFALLVGIVLIPAAIDVCSSILNLDALGNLISFVVSIFAYMALIVAVDNPAGVGTIQNAYRMSARSFFPFLFVSLITGFLVVVGLFALLLPGFLFMVWFTCAAFVVVLEKKGVVDAITQSRMYARGQWSPIFGRLVMLGLFILAVITPFAILCELLGLRDMGVYFVAWLATPLSYVYLYLLYQEIKRT